MSTTLAGRPTRTGDRRAPGDEHQRHADVLVVDEQRVPEVAVVLAERLAVVTEDDEQRALVEAARAETVDQIAQRSIAVVQRVLVARRSRSAPVNGPRSGDRVRMMSGDRQVGEEESPVAAALASIHASIRVDRRRLVHAEARFDDAANARRRPRPCRIPARGRPRPCRDTRSDRSETAPCDSRAPRNDRGERRARGMRQRLGRRVERRRARAQRREQALDALGIDRVRVLEDDAAAAERREVRHRIVGGAVQPQVLRACRLEHDDDDVEAGGGAAEVGQILAEPERRTDSPRQSPIAARGVERAAARSRRAPSPRCDADRRSRRARGAIGPTASTTATPRRVDRRALIERTRRNSSGAPAHPRR